MFIEPKITRVSSGLSGYIWFETKFVLNGTIFKLGLCSAVPGIEMSRFAQSCFEAEMKMTAWCIHPDNQQRELRYDSSFVTTPFNPSPFWESMRKSKSGNCHPEWQMEPPRNTNRCLAWCCVEFPRSVPGGGIEIDRDLQACVVNLIEFMIMFVDWRFRGGLVPVLACRLLHKTALIRVDSRWPDGRPVA